MSYERSNEERDNAAQGLTPTMIDIVLCVCQDFDWSQQCFANQRPTPGWGLGYLKAVSIINHHELPITAVVDPQRPSPNRPGAESMVSRNHVAGM